MEEQDNLGDYKKLREQTKNYNDEKYRESSKKRLMKNVERKFKTTMIGALASFEKYFGDLWGHDEGELSDEQIKMKQFWEQARTEILNNGNSQLRIAQEEIAQYTMTWNRYHIDFVLPPTKEDNQEN
jgi:hypothetical protein